MENERLNKWRPNDWETLDCDKCQCREARCETWCTLYRTYEDAASAMLAARDKWWRGLLQEVNEANDLKDLQERFAHLLRYTADLDVKQ